MPNGRFGPSPKGVLKGDQNGAWDWAKMEPEMEPKLSLFGAPKQWKTLGFLVFSLKMAPRRGTNNGAKNGVQNEPEIESKSGPEMGRKWGNA